jgi:hypothetical protein
MRPGTSLNIQTRSRLEISAQRAAREQEQELKHFLKYSLRSMFVKIIILRRIVQNNSEPLHLSANPTIRSGLKNPTIVGREGAKFD